MGEADEPKKTALTLASEGAMVADKMGGRVHVRWDETAQATPHGQIVFFAEFLATAGDFDRWVQGCRLGYSSPNASRPRDVLGTLMLGILAGSKRYAHIAGVRGDAVAARALGLQGMVNEDSMRRALRAMAPEASQPRMSEALMSSVREALQRPWVLDLDATIKPLYGHQEGAEVGYNPHKPGRPSPVLHTFWVGNLRLVLDAVHSPGKQHTSGHAKAAMARLLDELGDQAPALVRGDCGYGNEDIIDICEQRDLRYLLRLRKMANVMRLIERLFRREDWTRASEASQGWQAIEDELRLSGWSKARRVVVLRRRIKNDMVLTNCKSKRDGDEQLVLALPLDEVQEPGQMWEYTGLVTDAPYDIAAIGQLYRDRCDWESGFDELKNQWGWGGFTTQDMHSSQITGRAAALVYNWWSWYVRAANPRARREALTSRPLLLAAVGRATSSGNQTRLYLTPMHAEAGLIKSMIANAHAALQHVRAAAEELPKLGRWRALLDYIYQRIVGQAACQFCSALRPCATRRACRWIAGPRRRRTSSMSRPGPRRRCSSSTCERNCWPRPSSSATSRSTPTSSCATPTWRGASTRSGTVRRRWRSSRTSRPTHRRPPRRGADNRARAWGVERPRRLPAATRKRILP